MSFFLFLLRGDTCYFHGFDFVYTWLIHLQGMQMIFYMLFQIFAFKEFFFLNENWTSLSETMKIVEPRGVHGACFFQLQGPLALGGARVPPSSKLSGGQNC